jgi:hypothetical protein
LEAGDFSEREIGGGGETGSKRISFLFVEGDAAGGCELFEEGADSTLTASTIVVVGTSVVENSIFRALITVGITGGGT